jgi:hypothetical protein
MMRRRQRERFAKLTFAADFEEFKYYEDYEEGKVQWIKKYLRTPEQRQWLNDHDFSIEDVLNGRIPMNLYAEVRFFFVDWNIKMGYAAFG